MATAMIYPEPEKDKRHSKSKLNNSTMGFDKSLLSQARTVLAFDKGLANTMADSPADGANQPRKDSGLNCIGCGCGWLLRCACGLFLRLESR